VPTFLIMSGFISWIIIQPQVCLTLIELLRQLTTSQKTIVQTTDRSLKVPQVLPQFSLPSQEPLPVRGVMLRPLSSLSFLPFSFPPAASCLLSYLLLYTSKRYATTCTPTSQLELLHLLHNPPPNSEVCVGEARPQGRAGRAGEKHVAHDLERGSGLRILKFT